MDDKIFHWEKGKCLVFDDAFPHEVWNDTEATRVVLFLQFKRPLRQPGKVLGDLFLAAMRYSPYVQEARRNFNAWEAAQQRIERG